MNTTQHLTSASVIALTGLAVSPAAFAHGDHLHNSVMAGMMHPLTGADHLLMLTLSGLLLARIGAAQPSGLLKNLFLLLLSLVAGTVLGQLFGPQLWLESALLASLPVMLLVHGAIPTRSNDFSRQHRHTIALAVTGLLLTLHGWAHGVELVGSAPTFIGGMVISAVVLLTGSALAARFMLRRYSRASRPGVFTGQ